jgi:hypothetical protein
MRIRRWEAALFLMLCVYSYFCFFGGHFGSGIHAVSMVEDDFYYYVRIAGNIVAGHGSTFDGSTATNGYHPLWMGVIVLLSALTKNVTHVIAAVYVIAIGATLSTFLLSRIILRRFVSRVVLADLAAVLVTLFASDLYRSGMEIIATIPLALGLIVLILRSKMPWSARRVFALTLLAALVVLSRIDSAILIGALGLSLLFVSAVRRSLRPRHLLAVVLGASPLILYLASNVVYFGTLLPISGEAKQLRTVLTPSLRGIQSISWISPLHGLPFFAVILGLGWLLFAGRHLDRVSRATLGAALAFPIAQVLLLSLLSDWILFPWYFYSSAIGLCAALVVFLGDETSFNLKGTRVPLALLPLALGTTMAVASLLYAARIVANTWHRPPSQRVAAGLFVAKFAAAHPGRYAMGDRAGFAGIVVPDPFVQLEGLVMDKRFLQHIRNQDDLMSVMREYRIDYYVATVWPNTTMNCFAANEPYQAGSTSPHMKAAVCGPPVAAYETPNGLKTVIFSVNSR